MATPSILQRVKDTASRLGKATKTLPPDQNEAEGLKAVQQNVDQVSAPPQKAQEEGPSSGERLVTHGPYGSEPGQKRFSNSELKEMTHPLGKIPVYDEGGDVKTAPEYKSRYSEVEAVAKRPKVGAPKIKMEKNPLGSGYVDDKPSKDNGELDEMNRENLNLPDPSRQSPIYNPSTPVYDEGGDVDVEDGKHQVAVLQDGEKVLTPEQAAAYDAEHGAPADFGGRVIANPEGIKVHDDSEPLETERISGGAKMNTDNAPLKTPEGDISNPEDAQVKPEGMREMSAKTDLSGQKPKLDPNSPAGQILQQDKVESVKKGDLVGLGKALLGEEHLRTPFDTTGSNFGDSSPSVSKDETLKTAVKSPMNHKATLADYDQKIQQALDKAAQTNDPAFQEQADRLKLAKAQYEKNTPWGSANNHPGILGKIGHGLAEVGNIAGDVIAPEVMQNIPGTQLNKQAQASRLGQAISTDTASNLAQEEEKYKENALEVGKTPEQVTFRSLLKATNPATGANYTPEEALAKTKEDENTKEKETFINDELKKPNPTTGKNFTREEATEAYYQMRAGTRPTNPKEQELKDYMKAHELQDTPQNRDLARVEVEKRNTTAKAEAALPAAEHKIRLQSQLSEANADLNANHADALQRGKSADEFLQKENARHNLRLTQIDSAQDALDKSDTNELAASIVPVLATMTESNEQNIKRLNPKELEKFMPKSSGDAKQWFEANYDKIVAGQIPAQYRGDLRELLNGVAREEAQQYEANTLSIDQTLRQGAVAPKVNEKGKVTGSQKSKPGTLPEVPKEVPAGATHIYRDKDKNVVGYALDNKYHAVGTK